MARRVGWRSLISYVSLFFRSKDDAPESIVTEESFSLGEAPTGTTRSSGTRDTSVSLVKRIGLSIGEVSTDFEPPEWDFNEITNAYNTEGYIRQAVDKYIEMMFKADWKWVGKNPAAVEYVDMRFKLMAESTQIPTDQLFIEIAEDLVKYCNVTVAKARAKDVAIFQGLNVTGLNGGAPVAGYFPLNLATMQTKRDKTGLIKSWQQEVDGQDKAVKFKPEDMVHYYYKREKGRVFGTPWLLPAIDDIRALRQIEENILRLVYRNLHPLWHIQVGDKAEGMHGEDKEVDAVRAEVENMDVEGGLVTTERVTVSAIASNQIIDANNYLCYFEQRAFTVLGVSEMSMGRGGTANRSTGDNLSGEFKDRIKALQKVMSMFTNEFMVKEILMEGGFDPVLNPDDAVLFTFNEIDLDSKIKSENQAVFLYEHNAITESEMRELIGRDPILDGEERAGMHLQMVTIAQATAEAALAPTPTAGGTASGGSKPKTAATDNKTKPTNQHGTKTSPKKTTNSGVHDRFVRQVEHEYGVLREATHHLLTQYHTTHEDIHLVKLQQVFAYTQERFKLITLETYGEPVYEGIQIPIERALGSLHKTITTSIDTMESAEALKESIEVSQASFDVFTDVINDIVLKANAIYNEDEGV